LSPKCVVLTHGKDALLQCDYKIKIVENEIRMSDNNNNVKYPKARMWMVTIPWEGYTPYRPPSVAYIKGQLERGSEGEGYLHWQLFVHFSGQQRLSHLRKVFGNAHAEPTRSEAAEDYVWKEETRVEGTQFELGNRPFKRNCSADWAVILNDAKSGNFDGIPPDVLIRYYGNLKRIAVENAKPVGIEKSCWVFWGKTGTGKSHRAWEEGTIDAYPKDPNSKFWDGYRGQENVVIDEFRGTIGISHILRWLDKYPCIVEVKGSSVVLKAKNFWITSNLSPKMWYPDLDEETFNALMRRLKVVEIKKFI